MGKILGTRLKIIEATKFFDFLKVTSSALECVKAANVEVWLGREEEDVGIEFDIAVILVNEEDDQYYSNYLARGKETGDYPGIPLPPSANIMDVITVFRK